MMRSFLYLLMFFLYSGGMYAQKFSLQVETLTDRYFLTLSEEQKPFFRALLKQRTQRSWLKRIDKQTYDYAFIEERVCFGERRREVTERYFIANDSIPKYVYMNGKSVDPAKIYDGFTVWYSKNVTYYTTLHPLKEKYSALAAVCELPYDSVQIWSHGCVTPADAKETFTARRSEELKKTWQIQTMIDRQKQQVVVSLQYAPEHPIFVTLSYNGVWDW
ncbi:MAG: hypothetical protein IBJ09_07050 [Bacteroidia bacterium]|nr:hypothetical protein [Bacteroidia bacterium]